MITILYGIVYFIIGTGLNILAVYLNPRAYNDLYDGDRVILLCASTLAWPVTVPIQIALATYKKVMVSSLNKLAQKEHQMKIDLANARNQVQLIQREYDQLVRETSSAS